MNTNAVVVGIVQERNQWPLIAVSICHALLHHVDCVYVLEHCCTDESREGINRLRTLWKDRLRTIEYQDDEFFQEASTHALMELCQEVQPDWIYVFDADEFLVAGENQSLQRVIGDMNHGCSAIRYGVRNWVSYRDFDDGNLEEYRELRYRSTPTVSPDADHDHWWCADQIATGRLTFFDITFKSKLIVRNDPECWLRAGAHVYKHKTEGTIANVSADVLSAAHFPFLTMAHLFAKAKHGENYTRTGMPPWHGWQEQMLYKFRQQGQMETFWERHSLSRQQVRTGNVFGPFVRDDSFSRSIDSTLSFIESRSISLSNRTEGNRASDKTPMRDTHVKFSNLVHVARKFQLIADSIAVDCDELRRTVSQRDSEIQNFRNQLLQQETALSTTVGEKDAEISLLRAEVGAKTRQAEMLADQTGNPRTSAVHQLLQRNQRVINCVFPERSLRKKVARILLREGWYGLFARLTHRLGFQPDTPQDHMTCESASAQPECDRRSLK